MLQGEDGCSQTVEHDSSDAVMTSFGGTGNSAADDASAVAAGRGVKCEFPGCRREFRELKHLKVHRLQHTDERPLSCALCSYSCRQRNSLNWHMQSRHGLSKQVTDDGRTVYVSSSSSWHHDRNCDVEKSPSHEEPVVPSVSLKGVKWIWKCSMIAYTSQRHADKKQQSNVF